MYEVTFINGDTKWIEDRGLSDTKNAADVKFYKIREDLIGNIVDELGPFVNSYTRWTEEGAADDAKTFAMSKEDFIEMYLTEEHDVNIINKLGLIISKEGKEVGWIDIDPGEFDV